MKILIIYDYKIEKTGLGHKTRCLALQEAFVSKNISCIALQYGHPIPTPYLYECDMIIVDSYLAPIGYYNKLTDQCSQLVVIDDNGRLTYPSGSIIINPNIYGNEIQYMTKNNKKGDSYTILCGSEFVILRKEFENIPRKKINRKIKNVLITLGGSDKAKEIVKEIVPQLKDYDVRVLTPTDRYEFSADIVLKEMLWADMAISGCGVSLNELARVGVPTLTINLFDNASRNGATYIKEGFISGVIHPRYLRIIPQLFTQDFPPHKFRKHKSKIGRSLIDGQGANRVVDTLIRRYNG